MTQSNTPTDILISAIIDNTDTIPEALTLCLAWAEFFVPIVIAASGIEAMVEDVLTHRDDLLAAILQDKTVTHIVPVF